MKFKGVLQSMENTGCSSAVDIRNLTKSFGTKRVLDNLSFNVKKGGVMGFLGPNGAGKSTTMNILCGYISSDKGSVFIDGIDASEDPIGAKRKIGFLPEIPPLYVDMTVMEYLDFVYELKGVKKNKSEHLKNIAGMVSVYDVGNRLIKNLSKGYKQRIGLAQALIGDPEILILDEPTVGLDPRQIMDIRRVITEVGKERTVILSTHILQEVTAVCDSYTIINGGKIVSSGSMNEFKGDGSTYRLKVAADKTSALAIAGEIENVVFVSYDGSSEANTSDLTVRALDDCDIRGDVFRAFAEKETALLSFYDAAPSLEEVFMRAVSSDYSETEGEEKSI